MSYASNADVQQRMGPSLYVQLTDDGGTGTADETKIAEARSAAEAEVNSYLARRYGVPVNAGSQTELASMLRSLTLDLVEHRLHSRRPPVRVDIVSKRAAALDWLQRAAEGKVVLPSSQELPGSTGQGIVAAATGSQRVWTRNEAEGL